MVITVTKQDLLGVAGRAVAARAGRRTGSDTWTSTIRERIRYYFEVTAYPTTAYPTTPYLARCSCLPAPGHACKFQLAFRFLRLRLLACLLAAAAALSLVCVFRGSVSRC
ncbi:hypothetical protein NL676_005810 [Syzygium grande]|nr:hypothetical protein NL676_005810 [Syzygium grande]